MKVLIACKAVLVLAMSAGLAFAGERTVTLSIDGMVCPICARNVKNALERVAGVTNVQMSVKDKTAIVVYDDASAALAQAVECGQCRRPHLTTVALQPPPVSRDQHPDAVVRGDR